MAFLYSIPLSLHHPHQRLRLTSATPIRQNQNQRHRNLIYSCRQAQVPAANSPSLDAALSHLRSLKGGSTSNSESPSPSTVYLVGTGPGDASLLTLRAVELMSRADVVLYDRLVSDEILSYINEDAVRLYVGKSAGLHTRSQDEIHVLLRTFAGTPEAKTVIRLKGGDPGIFGRGGEEAAYLRSNGVNVEIVPGVTAASGIAAALGFPLTMRGVANGVRYVTGHAREGGRDEICVGEVSREETLVFYMALAQLEKVERTLRDRGLDMNTPAVAVEKGTTKEQRTVWASIGELKEKVDKAKLKSPTLVVVGWVVALALEWPVEKENAVHCRALAA